MKFKSFYLTMGLLWAFAKHIYAQPYGYSAFSSCKSQGSANFAALNNPSELINNKTLLSYSISNPYGVKDLYAAGFNLQTSNTNIGAGISWQNEGNQAYQINRIGLSTALIPIKDLSFGIKGYFERINFFKYHQINQSNIDLSLGVKAHAKIKTCFIIKNTINRSVINDKKNEQNHIIIWSLGYDIERRLKLLFEFEKTSFQPLELRTAIAFQKDSLLNVNICAANGGKQLGLGIGLKKRKTEIGFAFTMHILLGFSTCLSLAYEIKS
jgi:hypothetical protein